MRHFAPFILVLGALLAPVAAFAAPGVGEVGSTAAEFSLGALDGSTHALSDYPNKVVFFFVVGWG
jgi:hypothetical protein